MHLHLPAPAPPCPAEVSWGDAHRGGLEGCEDLGQSALGWDSPTFRLVSELHLGSSPSSIKQELGLGSQSRFRPSRLRPWPPPQPFESCRAAFFKYLRSQKQVKNIWALPAGMREGKFNGRLPAPRAFRGSAGARARAKNFKLFSLMPLFFLGGGDARGGGKQREMRCQSKVFLPSCFWLQLRPRPRGRTLNSRPGILSVLKLIDFIRELQIETRRGGFEMSKKSCKRKKEVGGGGGRRER